MFNERQAAQMAAFFIRKEGGTLNIMKLIKLLYLSDRESMDRYQTPITDSNIYSMDHGPVLSEVYDRINGAVRDANHWRDLISDRANHLVALARPFTTHDDDELSESDTEILEHVWHEFGNMDQWQLSDLTHSFKEWNNPSGSSHPIEYVEVFHALGREDAATLHNQIAGQRNIDRVFANL